MSLVHGYKLCTRCNISHIYKLPPDMVRTSTMVFLLIVLHPHLEASSSTPGSREMHTRFQNLAIQFLTKNRNLRKLYFGAHRSFGTEGAWLWVFPKASPVKGNRFMDDFPKEKHPKRQPQKHLGHRFREFHRGEAPEQLPWSPPQ